jgi:hypothetical protein
MGGTRIQAAVAGHAEQVNLHATRFAFGTAATRAYSALGSFMLWNAGRAA